ncbi:TolC family protein [Cerasicoccus frondis]|uniref:TolC family protein n=1 Tax=Cerasicoccus frondis TaxID=490090 RepID=UPI0028529DAB|nr:TolC family protein [Cerasicoccus frondis]
MFGAPLTKTLIRTTAALIALLAAPHVQADATLSLPETVFPELESILKQMEGESPDMLIRRAQVQAAEAAEQSRLAPKWPQVRLNLQMMNRSEFRSSDPTYQNTTQPFGIARLEQELYHWGALDAHRDIGKFEKAIADNNYQETYRLLTLRVRSLYLRLLFAREQVGFYQAESNRLQQSLSRSQQQSDAGRITADQLESDRLNLEESDIQLDRSRDEAQMLEEDLRLASGWQGPINGPTDGLLQRFQALALEEAESAAEIITSQAPPSVEYLNKQQQLNIAEANYTQIRSQNLPLLDFVTEAYQDQIATQGRDNIDRTVLAVYLRVNWHIFDGFQTKWEKIRSKAEQRALQVQAEHIAEKDKLDVERLKRERKLIERDIALWERRVSLSDNQLKRVQVDREKNTATENDLLSAQNTLLADRLTLANYRLSLFNNSTELLSLYGKDPFGAPKHPAIKPVEEEFDENFFW